MKRKLQKLMLSFVFVLPVLPPFFLFCLNNCSPNEKAEIIYNGSSNSIGTRTNDEIVIVFKNFLLLNTTQKCDDLLDAFVIFSDYDSFEAKISPTEDNYFDVIISSKKDKNIPNNHYLFNLVIYDKNKEVSLFNRILSFDVHDTIFIPDIKRTDFVYKNNTYCAIYPGLRLYNGLKPTQCSFKIEDVSAELGTLSIQVKTVYEDDDFCQFNLMIVSNVTSLPPDIGFSYNLIISTSTESQKRFLEGKFETSSFNDDTWENVAYWANTSIDFMRARYNVSSMVGMTKDLLINDMNQTVIVIGENHDELSNDFGKAMLTFKFDTSILYIYHDPEHPVIQIPKPMKSNWDPDKYKHSFSWSTSNVRTALNTSVKQLIDQAMGFVDGTSCIKTIKKITATTTDARDISNFENTDENIWVLSCTEIGAGKAAEESQLRWADEGECYEYFSNIESLEENDKRAFHSSEYTGGTCYWLRTPSTFCTAMVVWGPEGSIKDVGSYSDEFDLLPCFCI